MVTSLTLAFSQPVTLGANAVVLSGVSNVNYTLVTPDSGLTYVLTFSGTGFDGGSLADGTYTLHVNHDAVSSAASSLTMTTDAEYGLHRMYSDIDGDRSVTISDFNAFAVAFGTTRGNATFNAALDSDGDGSISITDFNMLAVRFGTSL